MPGEWGVCEPVVSRAMGTWADATGRCRGSLCDKEDDLASGPERLECHLNVLRRAE